MIIIPVLLYLTLMLFIAYRVNKLKNSANVNFTEEYFMGSRNMGGFVLAMTIVAAYVGASSFIGGPGVAYKLGLGWVLLACIQLPTAFLTLGILGKKLAIISRKLESVTIVELLKKRYNSDAVVIISSIAMLLFFLASIVVQFIGGGRLFESMTGYSYMVGLLLFSSVCIIYTSFGGFRTVTTTDAIQGVIMLIATIMLFFAVLKKGGGMENIMMTIAKTRPEMLTPYSNGAIPKPFILSFWILVGIGVLGYPATAIRCMGFKDTKSLHRAMIIGTSVVGVLMLGMHLIGVMGYALEPNLEVGDKIIPILTLKTLHPVLAGIFIGGPLAAIMSTVDSMLIMCSATLIKDLYSTYINKNTTTKDIKKISVKTSIIIGIVVFILALKPPKLIVWLNLFAFSGLEATFFSPIVFGLFWKKANNIGAIASMIVGIFTFIFLTLSKISILGLHNIVPVLFLSSLAMIIGSNFGKKPDIKTIETFFEM